MDLLIKAGKTGKEARQLFKFEPLKQGKPRQWRTKEPVTEPSLKGVQWLVLVALIFLGPKIGWWNLVGILLFVGCFKLGSLLWRERDFIRSAVPLFFGNYAAREAAENEQRRLFESSNQPTQTTVTEDEIDDIEAIMKFAECDTASEAVGPPPPSKREWLSLPIIWVLYCWPVYFWPRYFWQHLCQHPSTDPTDHAEDWMWWCIFVAIPSLMFVGWNTDGASIPFWLVLLSYAISGGLLWWTLTLRRNTTT